MMAAPIFRIALTRDYLNEQGELAYGDIGLALLDDRFFTVFIRIDFF